MTSDYQKCSAEVVTLGHTDCWTDATRLRTSLRIDGEYAIEKSRRFNFRLLSVANGEPAKPLTTLGNPNAVDIGGNAKQRLVTDFKATTLGLYAQDTIELTPYWKLVAGLRLDKFRGDYERPRNPALNNTTLSGSNKLLSKRFGVMYQPTGEVSYYAAYGTSFNTSGDLYQYNPISANTPPESSRNFEIGAKQKLMGGDLSLRTALARTEKYNERNTDIDTANNSYLLSGNHHTHALEFEVAGCITPQWDVFAGIGFLKVVIDQSGSNSAGQAELGQNQELRPSRQANLFTTYRVTGNWRVGAGFTATSQNEPTNSVASANRAYGYVKADAMVEHKISQTHTLKLNVDNIFDRGQYNTLYRSFAAPCDERSVRVTLNSKF